MKYPKKQFEILKKALTEFKKYVDIENMNYYDLHFKVFQQFSQGQKHNILIVENNTIKRKFSLDSEGQLIEAKGKNLINFDFDFELYPEGCNDNHIYTGVKNAIKQI